MCSPWSFPGLQVPKASLKDGMHFCGISTEWWNYRQYHPELKNKTAWVLDLQAGTSAVKDSLESWSRNSLLGQGQHPGALAQQGKGTGTTCFTFWGALNALSSQTEGVGKPRPSWLLLSVGFGANWTELNLSVGFMSPLSLHCTTAQQGQACPDSELHPSGVGMFGVWAVLEMPFVKLKLNVQAVQEEVGDCGWFVVPFSR